MWETEAAETRAEQGYTQSVAQKPDLHRTTHGCTEVLFFFCFVFIVTYTKWLYIGAVLTRRRACTRLYKNHVDFVQQADSRKNKLYTTWLAYWGSWSLPFQCRRGATHKMINAQQEINRVATVWYSLYTLLLFPYSILPRNTNWNLSI